MRLSFSRIVLSVFILFSYSVSEAVAKSSCSLMFPEVVEHAASEGVTFKKTQKKNRRS